MPILPAKYHAAHARRRALLFTPATRAMPSRCRQNMPFIAHARRRASSCRSHINIIYFLLEPRAAKMPCLITPTKHVIPTCAEIYADAHIIAALFFHIFTLFDAHCLFRRRCHYARPPRFTHIIRGAPDAAPNTLSMPPDATPIAAPMPMPTMRHADDARNMLRATMT